MLNTFLDGASTITTISGLVCVLVAGPQPKHVHALSCYGIRSTLGQQVIEGHSISRYTILCPNLMVSELSLEAGVLKQEPINGVDFGF